MTATELEFANRSRLEGIGIPFSHLWGEKAAYLDSWLAGGGRVMDCAARAGVSSATVRKWRAADPKFKQAEIAVRTGTKYVDPATIVPEPKINPDLLERWEHSAAIIADLRPLERGTRFERAHKRGVYAAHREVLADIAAELKAAGQPLPGAVPARLPERRSITYSDEGWGAPSWSRRSYA
jgi:hypothetical protein